MRNYGTLTLTATSPVQSFAEPLTFAEVVKFLELPVRTPEDQAEQAMIDGFITGAREQAELFQGRDLVPKQYDLALDYFPGSGANAFYSYATPITGEEIELRRPLISVDLMRYRHSTGEYTTMAEDTNYVVDLARGIIVPPYGESWPSFVPWPSSAVLVRYTSGITATDVFWSDAGARVKIGMKYLISEWYNNRLPFEMGPAAAQEYPFSVTHCLSAGGNGPRVR